MGHFVNFLTYKITIMLFCICLLSCNKRNCDSFKYIVSDKHTCIQHIVNWNVVGSYTQQQDSLLRKNMQKGINGNGTLISGTSFKFRYNDVYEPKYGQLDLKEVFNINVADTTKVIDSLVTYLSCKLQLERSRNMFLLVNTKMEHTEYMNGDSLTDKGFKELYIIPVSLKSGENDLVVRVTGGKCDYRYEATLYDSVSIAKMYAEEHTGNIIYPIMEKNIFLVGEDFTNPLVGDLVK